jgi:hypothetical protein
VDGRGGVDGVSMVIFFRRPEGLVAAVGGRIPPLPAMMPVVQKGKCRFVLRSGSVHVFAFFVRFVNQSVRMGLAGPKNKQRIQLDPRNTRWANGNLKCKF